MYLIKKYSNIPFIPEENWILDSEKLEENALTTKHEFKEKEFHKEKVFQKELSKMPFVNIGMIEDDIIIEVDLSGYSKENITVSHKNNVITVNAKYTANPVYPKEVKYLSRKIPQEDITKNFYLSNDCLDVTVKWKFINGLLCILVELSKDNNNSIIEESEELFTQGDQNE